MMRLPYCPLCHTESELLSGSGYGTYAICPECGGHFKLPEEYLTPAAEKERYLEHNNDVHDERYRKFVSPIVKEVISRFTVQHQGLDYGAGTGPVITQMLHEQHFQVKLYDPFFHPEPAVLDQTYDFIVCCEVIEHFFKPDQEFIRLHKLLKPNGALICMTKIYLPENDFLSWYYLKDPTHVFLYQHKTLEWIREHIGFKELHTMKNLIVFEKGGS